MELVLKSAAAELGKLEPFLASVLGTAEVDEMVRYNAMLILTEAVNNAIHHGNKDNPEKFVYLSAEFEGGRLMLTVRDEGEGFNPSTLPDPLDPANLLRTSGRGVFLMKALAEEYEYSHDGQYSTVRVVIRVAE